MSVKRLFAAVLIAVLGFMSNPVMTYAGESFAQQPKFQKNPVFSGVVKDDKGETLPGVAVRTSDGKHHTSTDINGKFTIQVNPSKDASLTFYYLGMKDEVVHIFKKGVMVIPAGTQFVVKMKSDSEVLEEVVVTGYGNISKKSFTGTVTSVSNKDIMKAAPSNAIAALQIFDPSLRLSENMLNGSNPNSLPEMTVRGQSSMPSDGGKTSMKNNPNLPTFILDGFEVSYEKVYDLDVSRIESMTLLKDAAATAMYGSRAANGVMVITTIPPKAGKVNVSYTLDLGLQTPDLSYYNLMDSRQKIEAEVAAGLYHSEDSNVQIRYDQIYNAKMLNVERGVFTDWMRLPLRNSLSHKHSLYVDGGEGSLRYGIDLKYDRNAGVMKGSFREKIAAGLSLSYNYKSINIRNYVSFDNTKGQESPYGNYSSIIKMNPYDTYLDENGNVLRTIKPWNSEKIANPVYDATLSSHDWNKSKQFRDNLELRWNITDYLNIRAGIGMYYDMQDSNKFTAPESTKYDSMKDKGELNLRSASGWGYDLNALLYYNQVVKKNHFNLSVGINLMESATRDVSTGYVGFPEGGFSSPEYAEKLRTSKPLHSSDRRRLFGTLLMFNYSFDNIYLVDISGRIDGSSQFGSKRKFAPFASGGLGLNIHNYDAVRRGAPWLSQLKIRASYGQTGKVNFASYEAQDKFNIVIDQWFPTGSAAVLNNMGNPNLKWETTDTFEYGGELGVFDGVFYLKANRYHKLTRDMIASMTLPTSSGFVTYRDNIGQLLNKGWELNMRARLYNTKDSQLFLFTNLSHNKNKLIKISDSMRAHNEQVENGYKDNPSQYRLPQPKYYPGASMNAIYAMKSLGIDPATGKELYQYADGTVGYEWVGSENVVVGNTDPDISGSFGLNFYFKGFTLDAYFMFEYGGQMYNTTLLDKVERGNIRSGNCDVRVMQDRWKLPGDVTSFKNIKDWEKDTQPTSRFVQDYNWLKLSSLSIGYEVPLKYISKARISRLKFQFNCSDIFTVSTIKIEKGTSYPFARGYNFTANITF